MLHDDLSVADAFRLIAHERLQHFSDRAQEFGDIGGATILHQCRVANRELRSALGLFRPMLDAAEAARFRTELRWIAGQLQDARNLDVLLARHFQGNGRHAGLLLDRILLVHEAAYAQATAAVTSHRRQQLVTEMNAWLSRDVSDGVHGQQPISPFAAAALRRAWRRVRRAARRRLDRMPPAELHRLRVRVKTLRYGVRFFRTLYASADVAVDDAERRLSEAQDSLGAITDLATAEAMLDGIGLAARERQAARRLIVELRQAQEAMFRDGDKRMRQMLAIKPFWRR